MTNPKLSFIIASRADNHCGDNLSRLTNTVNHLDVYYPDMETIVVDWGSPKPLNNPPGVRRDRVSFIYVPLEVTGPSFNEVLALNTGIRRARGTYVARLDQDTLPGLRFRSWVQTLPDNGNAPAFFSERREIAADFVPKGFCWEPSLHRRWSDWPDDCPHFFCGAVGVLLASRDLWHSVQGYDESLIHRNHMEHDLCMRLARCRVARVPDMGIVNLGPIVDYDFYHQYHDRPEGVRENPVPSVEWIGTCPLKPNGPDWGLGNLNLQEWES